jgi:hypothetical protein
MNLIVEEGWDVKEGRTREFVSWLEGNQEKLAQECPRGSKLQGVYFAVHSSDIKAGTVRVLWGFDNYTAMDTWTDGVKEGGAFARLLEEMTAFVDQRNDGHFSRHILRSVTDAAYWGD